MRGDFAYLGLALVILGGLALFYSLAILVVYTEAEKSAFPFPLGIPGLLILAVGLVVYAVSCGKDESAGVR